MKTIRKSGDTSIEYFEAKSPEELTKQINNFIVQLPENAQANICDINIDSDGTYTTFVKVTACSHE